LDELAGDRDTGRAKQLLELREPVPPPVLTGRKDRHAERSLARTRVYDARAVTRVLRASGAILAFRPLHPLPV
jgi:hypothetical protein